MDTITALPAPRVGLALSGGGAKGAYQEGVFEALHRLGISPLVEAVSGCSIGALNALLFAMGDPGLWRRVWEQVDFHSFLPRGEDGVGEGFGARFRELTSAARSARDLGDFLTKPNVSLMTQDGLRQAVSRAVDPQKLRAGFPKVSVCAYDMEEERPRYFWLSDRPYSQAVDLAMASSAIPVAFPPVVVDGHHFCDGGIVPPYLRRDNADKVPVLPLAEPGLRLDLVIVVYLTHYDRVDRSVFPKETRVLELYPSRPLEAAPGSGTLDLSPSVLARHMELGRQDAMAAFAPFFSDYLRGRPLSETLREHDERNRQLLEREQSLNAAVREEAQKVLKKISALGGRLFGGER